MDSRSTAIWEGDLKRGQGHLSTTSDALRHVPYSFRTRFEGADGTSPEELIAAAHAGCFSMALSKILAEAGHPAERISTQATVSLEQVDGGFAITRVHLAVTGRAPGATPEGFAEATGKAKVGCPVSKLLKAEITMEAKLEG